MKRLVLLTCFLLMSASAWAQTCPGFPTRGVEIIDGLFNLPMATGTDDQRRQLTRTFIEQLVYEFPSEGWTWKSADATRPPSKDSISRLFNGRLCNWDWQNGGSRLRSVLPGQLGEDVTGQNPLLVAGVNHLGSTSLPTPGNPPHFPPSFPPAATFDTSGIYQKIDWADSNDERRFLDLRNAIADVRGVQTQLQQQLTKMDTEPGWLMKILDNKYVQLAITSAGSVVTALLVKK